MVRWLIVATALLTSIEALGAPPPPAPYPANKPRTFEGYDVATYYQIYRNWIEAKKSDAVEAIMAEIPEIEGERAVQRPLIAFKQFNDFGHYLSGEVRAYCKPEGRFGIDRSQCRYVLRRVYVDVSAAPYGGEIDPVSEWMEANYVPGKLVARLKNLGIAPGANVWGLNEAEIFETFPSPVPVLQRNATVVTLGSEECPAMQGAIVALEGKSAEFEIDLLGAGTDHRPPPPRPHSVRWSGTINFLTASGDVSVTGGWETLSGLVKPIIDAANECEERREASLLRGDNR